MQKRLITHSVSTQIKLLIAPPSYGLETFHICSPHIVLCDVHPV